MSTVKKTASDPTRKHVVIVGGGFAGLRCAQALATVDNIRVTLLDKNNYQQFQPLLYQVATASLAPHRAAFNLRSVLFKQSNVDVRMTEIVEVDLSRRIVTGRNGDTHVGDYLVLAAGAQPNFFDIPGVEEFSFPMYTLLDAERLRSRVIEVLEATDEALARGESPVAHLTVIGGGATGVEIAGAVADICDRAPKGFFKNLRLQDVVVTLINGKEEILTGFTEKSSIYAKRSLESRGVRLCLSKEVKELTSEDILLSDGTRLPCTLAIWAGGLKAAPLAPRLRFNLAEGVASMFTRIYRSRTFLVSTLWGTLPISRMEAGGCFHNWPQWHNRLGCTALKILRRTRVDGPHRSLPTLIRGSWR